MSQKNARMKCPSCGATVTQTDTECWVCGEPITRGATGRTGGRASKPDTAAPKPASTGKPAPPAPDKAPDAVAPVAAPTQPNASPAPASVAPAAPAAAPSASPSRPAASTTPANGHAGKSDKPSGNRPTPKALRSASPSRPPSTRVSTTAASAPATTAAAPPASARPDLTPPARTAHEPATSTATLDQLAEEAAGDPLKRPAPIVVKQIKPFQQPKPASWPANRQRRELAFDSPRRNAVTMLVAAGGLVAIIALAWFISSRLFGGAVPAAPAQQLVAPTKTFTPVPLATLVATIQGTVAAPTVVQAVMIAPRATDTPQPSATVGATETPLALPSATVAAPTATQAAPTTAPPTVAPATASPTAMSATATVAAPTATKPPAATETAIPSSTPRPATATTAPTAVPTLAPTLTPTTAPTATLASVGAASGQTYTVKAGDNCYNIARTLGVRLEDLLAINGLETGCTKLSVNQVLKVPAATLPSATARATTTVLATAPATATSQATAPATATVSATVLASGQTYVVKAGDTCYDIARAQNVSLEDLIKVNGLDQRCALKTGQVLALPTK